MKNWYLSLYSTCKMHRLARAFVACIRPNVRPLSPLHVIMDVYCRHFANDKCQTHLTFSLRSHMLTFLNEILQLMIGSVKFSFVYAFHGRNTLVQTP